MKVSTRVSTRDTVRVFSALSDVTRLEIMRLVVEKPRNVTELTSLVGVSQPKVSRHLRILRDAGLLSDVRRGKWVWYELAVPSEAGAAGPVISMIAPLVGMTAGGTVQRRGTKPVGDVRQPGAAIQLEVGAQATGVAPRGVAAQVGVEGRSQTQARRRVSTATLRGGKPEPRTKT
ncbi:MAG: metalloregulator ArsR/SmtB family transcription factor, partial [Candidatus Eisenbacteria bacterium]